MSDDATRAVRKITAVRRAEFRLSQRLDSIDWELDVLAPELETAKLNGLNAPQDSTIAGIEGPE